MELGKIPRIRMLLFISILLILLLVQPCSAMNTGFAVEDIDESMTEDILCRLEVIPITVEPDIKKGFSCFDVNGAGNIILGFDLGKKDVVLAYDSNGTFLFGFSLMDNGAFGLEWDENDIIVYRVRSDLAICLNSIGECIDIKQISSTSDNHDYWNSEIYANERFLNDHIYLADNFGLNSMWLRWGTYMRLSKVLPSGERIVLFDQSQEVTKTLLSILFFSATTIALLLTIIAHKKKRK